MLSHSHEKIFSDRNSQIFMNSSDFSYYFPQEDVNHYDFSHFNYVALEIAYDSCRESNLEPKGYYYENGVIHVLFYYKASCGVCAPEYYYYMLEIDKSIQDAIVDINYHSTNDPHCDPDIAYKPIIYLYPEEDMNVEVSLGNPDYLTITYPEYKDGWNYFVKKDGTIIDTNTSFEYYSLFWEGNHHVSKKHNVGFVVKNSDTLSFLEEKLRILGLNDKEAQEFIIYWYPKLKQSPYNYIYFETMDEINEYMPLSITPTPDSIIRIQMDYLPLKEPINVLEEKLSSPQRNGFTVVEWGGSIIEEIK